jgi:adenylyltransferase/sulfurtransferase
VNININKRYTRQVNVSEFGDEGQLKVAKSMVLVVGAGALGCPVLMYLTAAGVGTLGVLDGDDVDITNLHRQVLYTDADIGLPKTLAATNRLRAMNPNITIVPHQVHLNKGNAIEIISKYDIVVECSDNFSTKFLVNDACVILKKPFIVGGAIQFSGQLSVYNYQGGPTYRCLIPNEPDPLEVPSCSEAGVIGMVPGVIGTLQALEALKVISGVGTTLSGKLMHFDGLRMQFSNFDITLNPENLNIKELSEYEFHCPSDFLANRQISANELKEILDKQEPVDLIYFSDENEPFRYRTQTIIPLPIYELPNKVIDLPRNKKIILLCDYGIKSLSALRYLAQKHSFTNVLNLKEGLNEFKILFKQ